MRIVDWEGLGLLGRAGMPVAAAVGVFDGLHIGHQALVRRVLDRNGFASAVVTFRESPKRILSPSSFRGDLSTLRQKLGLIESMGPEFCVLIDFSGDFSKLPGRRFLDDLVGRGGMRYLAVGTDFRCGHRLDTDSSAIRAFCMERSIGVDLLPAVSWAGHPVSSSRIRKAVLEGRLEDAESMLGRPFEVDLGSSSQAMPPLGSYEARLEGRGGVVEVVASLGRDGRWRLPEGVGEGGAGSPSGLRLLRMVSRE